MKKLNILFIVLIGLTINSCSDENTNEVATPQNGKKLIKINMTDNYGDYEDLFIYDSNNNVIEIDKKFTEFGETNSDLVKEVFSYENNLVTSGLTYRNGELSLSYEFNYSNNQLVEIISYTTNGTEDEKYEFNYNLNGEINSLNYYVEEDLQQVINFTYNNDGNIIITEDRTDYSEIQYDINPTPYDSFSYANKIIFARYNSNIINHICENNVTNEIRTYNKNSSNEQVYNYLTTISYDSNNFPLSKTLVEINSNNEQRTVRTISYEYE